MLACTVLISRFAQAQLVIEGVEADVADRLQSQIIQLDNPCTASEARARGVARDAVTDSRDLLRALGYYQPQISQRLELDEQGCRTLYLSIDPGLATRILNIEIELTGEGESDKEFADLISKVPFAVGDRLRHSLYESYKSEFERVAVRRGYYDANFALSQIRVDTARSQATIHLRYATGVRYRYGEILIDEVGPSVGFISRYFPFASGDPVSSSQLIELQKRLIDSQYFSSVSVRPQVDQRYDGKVDVNVTLRPVKPWHYSVGLGVDTNSGPRASASVENRLLNPQGDRATADTSISPKLRVLELRHRHPLADPTREVRQWQAGVREEQTDSSDSTRYSVGWSRIRALDSDWIRTLGISFRREDSQIGTLDVKSQLLLPSIAWQKTVRVGDRRIIEGWRLGLDFSFGARNLLSDTSLAQIHGEAKSIIPLGPGRVIGRSELGTTWVEQFAEVPASLRYFAGGDNSVRGYDFKSIGPVDKNGDVVGGRHLLVASLEYDIPFATNWDAAVFVDSGDAFNNRPNMKQSVGLGVRWHSPVGTIRLDLAFPTDNGGVRFHIFMGPEL